MKKIVLILIIVGVVVWSMGNRDQVNAYAAQAKDWFERTVLKKTPEAPVAAEDEADKPAQSETKSNVVSSPTPSSTAPVVSRPAEPKKVEEALPEGYYYTKDRVTQVTDTGVAAIAKGVKVRKVGESNGDYVITDGTLEIPASPTFLTRDAAEIAALIPPAAPPKTEAKKAPSASVPVVTAAKPASTGPNPEIAALKIKLEASDNKILNLQRQLNDLRHEQELAKMRGRVTSTHVYIPRVQAQLDNATLERRKLEDRMRELSSN